MNVDQTRPSCLYSDPSVYVKTEYDATGKARNQSHEVLQLSELSKFILNKNCNLSHKGENQYFLII